MKIQNAQENEPIVIDFPLLTGAADMISFSLDEHDRRSAGLCYSLNPIYVMTIVEKRRKY